MYCCTELSETSRLSHILHSVARLCNKCLGVILGSSSFWIHVTAWEPHLSVKNTLLNVEFFERLKQSWTSGSNEKNSKIHSPWENQNLSIFNGLTKAIQLARLETRPVCYILYDHHIEKLVPSAQITLFPFNSIATRVMSMKYIIIGRALV